MKNLILLVLFTCLIFCGCGKKEIVNDDFNVIKNRDKIIVGVREDAPPFGFKDINGNFQGYDIDLSKYIAKAILGSEDKVEFIPVTASNRIMKLSSGEVDVLISAMSITEQRLQILDFSIPYHTAGQAILVRKNSDLKYLSDFKGKKMIIVFGSTGEKNLQSNVPEIIVVGYKDYKNGLNALKSGYADGMLADDTVLYGLAGKDNSVRILPKRYSKEPYAVAFRKEDTSKRLQEKINYIIENLQSTGKLNRLKDKWEIK